jgi:uncharacterized membrane protein
MQQETSEKPEQASGKPGQTTTLLAQHKMAPYWAALIGMAAIGVFYFFLPSRLIIGPNWLLLAIEAVFIIPIAIYLRSGRELSHATIHTLALVLLGILTLGLATGVVLLIVLMTTAPRELSAVTLLRSAALLWGVNVLVFALWYWELDGGGPYKRHLTNHQAADFMFPQQVDGNKSGWVPHFLDYLFLAFTGATALSPADTYPLSRPAKALMMIEAILSMTIIVLLAARAVNILGS